MKIPFTKMHGLGNDFVVVDARHEPIEALFAESGRAGRVSRTLADRRFGIGADQILVLKTSERVPVRMDIYNADGGRVEMCGNGIRCFARYVWSRGIHDADPLPVETLAGIVRPAREGDLVRVDMGRPVLEGPDIPVAAEGRIVDHRLDTTEGVVSVTCVSMGNPHAIIFVDDVEAAPVTTLGPEIEKLPFFPNRTNVEFVQVVRPGELRMRVWERGAGETLACGTGASAVGVAGVLRGVSERRVRVRLPGGELLIEWDEETGSVFMTGPAVEVFEGTIEVGDAGA